MSETLYIEKKQTLPKAMDYSSLKATGLEYIQNLAKDLWTDYNAHDPGITLHELLCYAITELGYRCQLPFENLITKPNGKICNETFFTASEILTNAPLTVLDYRKLLIDIDGINNAWLVYAKNENGQKVPLENEVPIYINVLEDQLSLLPKDKRGNDLQQLPLRGLNKIYIELSNHIQYGNLNDVSVDFIDLDGNKFLEATVTTEFTDWNDERANWFKNMNSPGKIKFLTATLIPEENKVELAVEHSNNPVKKLKFFVYPKDSNELDALKDYFDLEKNFCQQIATPFFEKKNAIDTIYKTVWDKLNENRNLSEDWLCLETISKTDIGICAKLHFKPGADIAETMSQVHIAIQTIFNPPIRFYTLKEMLAKGLSTPQIFQGPKLDHGFLIDEEVQKAQLPDCLHASDFISAIMQIDGIADVKEFSFTAYDTYGKPIENAKNEKWCLQLDGKSKPVFDSFASKFLLYKEQIPFFLSEQSQNEIAQKVAYVNLENDISKLKNITNDLPIPKGQYLPLNEYWSIQHELPATYKIGKEQMPKSASPLRKAQAKQLKAYLLHYDQLLADFFGQLHKAKDLLDIDICDKKEVNHKTYFSNYLQDIPGVEKANLKDEIYESGLNDFLNQANESQSDFYKRRNKFLDHLLARFAVSFNDYATMQYNMQQNARGIAELKIQQDELINDKQQFLQELPKLSSNRALGFNYMQNPLDANTGNEIWDNAVISGFQKRIARLLGINNTSLSDLVIFDNVAQNSWHFDTPLGQLPFMMLNDSGLDLDTKWEIAHQLINDVSAYDIRKTKTGFWIDIINEDGQRIAKYNHKFVTYKEAFEFIPTLYQAINSTLENMYCIEHILLRPMITIDETDVLELNKHLLQVCLNDDCFSMAKADAYSFKMTMVLRGDLARFRNPYFREYAERIIRSEAPAHILVKVCWISRNEMLSFQKEYKEWIFHYRKMKRLICTGVNKTLQKKYNQALKNLIIALKELNTIYDEGTLYDCQLSESQNPIILGKTSLGTL